MLLIITSNTIRLIKSRFNSVPFSPIKMYRAKRTQKADEKVTIHRWVPCAKIEKKIRVEINNKTYEFDVLGSAIFNTKGEAERLIIRIDNDDTALWRNGKIEISSKGHIIKIDKSSLGYCCGCCRTKKYPDTTGKLDFKKMVYESFVVRAHKGHHMAPYPTINAEITFPCGSIYYISISWKKDYEFTVELVGPAGPATYVR